MIIITDGKWCIRAGRSWKCCGQLVQMPIFLRRKNILSQCSPMESPDDLSRFYYFSWACDADWSLVCVGCYCVTCGNIFPFLLFGVIQKLWRLSTSTLLKWRKFMKQSNMLFETSASLPGVLEVDRHCMFLSCGGKFLSLEVIIRGIICFLGLIRWTPTKEKHKQLFLESHNELPTQSSTMAINSELLYGN